MGVGMSAEGVFPSRGGDFLPAAGIDEVAAREVDRVVEASVPDAVLSISREFLETRLPRPEEEATAAEDLPEPVGGAGDLGVLGPCCVGAERDRGALDHASERLAEHRAARYRNLRRRSLP